jgi:membrane protease YdiL (CAAX protease family)
VTPDDETPPPPPPARPGASIFTIEGRAAPGLFVVGWLSSILGLGLIIVGGLANNVLLVRVLGAGLLSLGLIAGAGNQAIERRARGEAYAGPSPIIVFAAILVVTNFVAALLGPVLLALFDALALDTSGPVAQLVAGLLTALVGIGLVRLLVVGTGALSWSEMQIRRPNRKALDDLATGAALAIPTIGLTLIVARVLLLIFQVEPESPLPPTGQISGLLLQLVTGAMIAPIWEEIVYRGFSLTAWQRSLGADRAIVRASLLFALAHVVGIQAGSLGEAIGLIAVGALSRLPVAWVLGLVFVRRRSIWASIGLHATFNGVLLILAHLAITPGAT